MNQISLSAAAERLLLYERYPALRRRFRIFSASSSGMRISVLRRMSAASKKQTGRPQVSKEDIPATFLRHYPAYKSKQLNVSELARVCNISRTTAYKYINLLES